MGGEIRPKKRATRANCAHLKPDYSEILLLINVLPPVDWTHGRRYGDGSGYAFPDQTDIASVLGSVKHKPLTRRPSALLDRPYARWLGIAQVGTTGSVAFRSNNRIVHAAIADVAAARCRVR